MEVDVRTIILGFLFVVLACPAWAQEIYVSGGASRDAKTGTTAGQWSVTYAEGLGEHLEWSLTYLNEGHQPNHYRDGLAPQIWGRTNILDRRLSLALGVGPYAYFDTKLTGTRDIYSNANGWGIISSAAATWYGASPLLFRLRLNYIETQHSFDAFSLVLGIGYQFGAPSPAGPLPRPPNQTKPTTENEITAFLGQTVLNSAKSETGTAVSVEYRRGLTHHFDWTIAWLNEGDSRPIGRQGVMTQLWAVRAFLDDHLALGVGGGPYLAQDKYSGDDGQRTTLAGAVSLTAAYRFHANWGIRATWHRIITDYSRDTDVFMGGLTYRF